MRFLIIFFLLVANVSAGQMDDFKRLKAEAEMAFGFEDEVYADTIYIENFRKDSTEIYTVQSFDPVKRYSEVEVFRRADSTGLNGTIITQFFGPHDYSADTSIQRYSIIAYNYKRGKKIRTSVWFYSKNSDVNSLNEPIVNHYALFKVKHNGFYLNEAYCFGLTIDYYQNGQISRISKEPLPNNLTGNINENVGFYEDGKPKSFNSTGFKNGVHHEYQLALDTLGDTTHFLHLVDYRRNGGCIETIGYGDQKHKLRTVWKNDTLLDILSENVILTDDREKVISLDEYCVALHYEHDRSQLMYTNIWSFRVIPEYIRKPLNLQYTLILSSNMGGDYYFLKSSSLEGMDDVVLNKFLKKNRKRIEALEEN